MIKDNTIKVIILYGYVVLTFLNFIVETILSKNLLRYFSDSPIEDEEFSVYRYQIIYTKLLSLLEISYAANFYFKKDLNTVTQVRIAKIIGTSIWLFLAIQFEFGAAFICYFVIAFFSFLLIGLAANLEHSAIYYRYNHQISFVPELISLYVVIQIIYAIQSATEIFLAVRILASIQSLETDLYTAYALVKLPVLLILRGYNRYESNIILKIRIYTIVNGIFSFYSVYYIIEIFVTQKFYRQLVSVTFEFLSLINIVLLLFATFITLNFQ